MNSWLSPTRWLIVGGLIAALMLGYGLWADRIGDAREATVRAEYTAEALVASEAARAKEQTLIAKNQKVTNDYIAEKKRGAAAAVANASRLRKLQDALDSAAGTDSAPLGGADDPRGRIAGQCAAALGILDGYAQDVAAKATALQNYANSVRVTP